VSLALLIVSAGYAQRQTGRADREKKRDVVLKVRDFEGLGKHSLVRTPVLVSRGHNPVGEWLRVQTEYDTYPEWIDELSFRYSVMSETVVEGQKVFFLFKQTVRYRDIRRGRRHLSAVFLRPNTIARYGMPVAVAVEILHNGQVIDGGTKQPKNYPERWWQDPRVVENERVTVKNGYLLPRDKTPFALVHIADYEAGF